jgi:hypothetical protein
LRVSQLAEDSLAPAGDADAFEDVELVNHALESFEADAPRAEEADRRAALLRRLSIEETARARRVASDRQARLGFRSRVAAPRD